ncbi:hypothetical protein [Evtepia gabavorous]|uniref:hypothetical protein n=1 Tax=Evtepia gabavorous TaxID=2211183 RepID=UPI003A93403B
MKSKRRLGICLAVGILVLAVSAAAAFGSVNGYARYKQAVKDLLLREDNFTVQAQTHLSVDGERLLSVQMDYAKAGLNSAYHSREDHGGESHQEYRTVLDGVRTPVCRGQFLLLLRVHRAGGGLFQPPGL